MESPSQTCHTESHSIAWQKTCSTQRKPDRSVLDLSTLEGWKAELNFVLDIYRDALPVPRCPSSNYHFIASRPRVEPTTSWSQIQCPTVTLPSHLTLQANGWLHFL